MTSSIKMVWVEKVFLLIRIILMVYVIVLNGFILERTKVVQGDNSKRENLEVDFKVTNPKPVC